MMSPSFFRRHQHFAWHAAVLSLLLAGCGEQTFSPTACPPLPTYSIAEARAFLDAGASSSSPRYPWLTDAERAALEEAELLGCYTGAQRHYSLTQQASSADLSLKAADAGDAGGASAEDAASQ